MKNFTSRLVTVCQRAAIIFALAIALTFSFELEVSGNKMQAMAKPLTPEAESYEVASPDADKDAKNVTDEIGDKLKLDKSIAPTTKRFIESVEKNGGEVVTPARKAVENAVGKDNTARAK